MFGRVDFRGERERERELFGGCLVGRGREENDDGGRLFSPGSQKSFHPKMGRKLGGRSLVIKAVFVLAENDFRKSFYMKLCVWLRMENRVFRKIIYFDRKIAPLTRKIFLASVLPSNHFRRHAKRERKRERERTHRRANRERKREIRSSSLRSHWSGHHPRPLNATVRSRHEPTN